MLLEGFENLLGTLTFAQLHCPALVRAKTENNFHKLAGSIPLGKDGADLIEVDPLLVPAAGYLEGKLEELRQVQILMI